LAGNPKPGGFVKQLVTMASGISPVMLWSQNEKAVSHFFGTQDSQLVEALVTLLKFKLYSGDNTESRNDTVSHFEQKNWEWHSKGWLRKQFFESLEQPMNMSPANFQLQMLLQARFAQATQMVASTSCLYILGDYHLQPGFCLQLSHTFCCLMIWSNPMRTTMIMMLLAWFCKVSNDSELKSPLDPTI
jgi:hypothetical protein